MTPDRPSLIPLIWRGLCRRCPRCATGRIFRRWFTLHPRCPTCDFDLLPADGNTWFFMYFSSAGVAGVFFLYSFLNPPESAAIGWLTIVPSAAVVMLASLPHRKGVAIAIDYYIDPTCGDPPNSNRQTAHSPDLSDAP